MSTISKGKAPIRPPNRPPVQRLKSLKDPRPRTVESLKSALRQPTTKSGPPTCNNPVCGQSDVASEDGNLVCQNCGTVVRDDHITSEVTFGETANGAAVLQGTHMGADQAYSHLSAPGGSKITGGQDSRKITENNGTAVIVSILHLRLIIGYSTTSHRRLLREFQALQDVLGSCDAVLQAMSDEQPGARSRQSPCVLRLPIHCLPEIQRKRYHAD